MLNEKKNWLDCTIWKPCCYFTCFCMWTAAYLTWNNKMFTQNGKNNKRWLFFHYWQTFRLRDQTLLIKNSAFAPIWFDDNFICHVVFVMLPLLLNSILVIICKLNIRAKFCKESFHISKLNTLTKKRSEKIFLQLSLNVSQSFGNSFHQICSKNRLGQGYLLNLHRNVDDRIIESQQQQQQVKLRSLFFWYLDRYFWMTLVSCKK